MKLREVLEWVRPGSGHRQLVEATQAHLTALDEAQKAATRIAMRPPVDYKKAMREAEKSAKVPLLTAFASLDSKASCVDD